MRLTNLKRQILADIAVVDRPVGVGELTGRRYGPQYAGSVMSGPAMHRREIVRTAVRRLEDAALVRMVWHSDDGKTGRGFVITEAGRRALNGRNED